MQMKHPWDGMGDGFITVRSPRCMVDSLEGRREQPSNTAESSVGDVAISAITVPSSLLLPSVVAVAAAWWHSSHSIFLTHVPKMESGKHNDGGGDKTINGKSNICQECGAEFKKPAYLKQHMQSHSLEEQLLKYIEIM
ncbi:Transcription factor IIIA, partial [Cucurbita argyrosperma subsp. sororia]